MIAEIKRASPSRGLIRADFDPAAIAASYERHGAACLSVLTDREFFGGSPRRSRGGARGLRAAGAAQGLHRRPLPGPSRRARGARIASCSSSTRHRMRDLRELERLAHELGMDVLVECHDAAQLERALGFETPLIGINNRDLRTFETRLETTLELLDRVPARPPSRHGERHPLARGRGTHARWQV